MKGGEWLRVVLAIYITYLNNWVRISFSVGYIEGIPTCRERDVGYIEGFPICRERDVGHMDAQIRDKARSSPAVGLLRALWTHFASAPFSAPVADLGGGLVMPLTTKQLRPLRVRVRAVSGVWGMWR